MKRWLAQWPVRFSIFVSIFNMEFVVIPLILKGFFNLDGVMLKVGACIWATAEIVYWYWFTGWVGQTAKKFAQQKMRESEEVKEAIDEAVGIGTEAMKEMRRLNVRDRAEEWICQYLIEPFTPEYTSGKIAFRFLKGFGQVFGAPLFFVFGLIPGLWIVGVVFCRITTWKTGFTAIIVGNMVKNIFFAHGWDQLWAWFVG